MDENNDLNDIKNDNKIQAVAEVHERRNSPASDQKEYLQLFWEDGPSHQDTIDSVDGKLSTSEDYGEHFQYEDQNTFNRDLDIVPSDNEIEPELIFNDDPEIDPIVDDIPIKPTTSSEENSLSGILDSDEKINFDVVPTIDPPKIDPIPPYNPNRNDTLSPTSGGLKKNPKTKSFMDVLNEIYEEHPDIPERSNLGPKPWLMKSKPPSTPVITHPELVKKLSNDGKRKTPSPKQTLAQRKSNELPLPPIPISNSNDARPSSRKKAQVDEPPEVPPFTPDALELVGEDVSAKVEVKSPKQKKKSKKKSKKSDPALDNQTVSDLAKAAMQALELSSSALLQFEKEKVHNQNNNSGKQNSYDDVARSPKHQEKSPQPPRRNRSSDNVYDDFPQDNNDVFGRPPSRRKVISVPTFQPVPKPTRNSSSNSGQNRPPIYDSTPLENKAIPNNKTMDMMYNLFGADSDKDQYMKNVQETRQLRTPQLPGENSRAPSRVGSVYSDWSECTVPDYPESLSGMSVQNFGNNYPSQNMPQRPRFQQGYQNGYSNPNMTQQQQGYPQNFNDPMRHMRPAMPPNQYMQQQQPPQQRMPVIPINNRPNPPQMYPLLGPNYEVHNLPNQNAPFDPYRQGGPPGGFNNQNQNGMFGNQPQQNQGWGQNSNFHPTEPRGQPRAPFNQYANDRNESMESERGRSQSQYAGSRASSRGRSRGRSHSRTRSRRHRSYSESSSDGYESLERSHEDEFETDKKAYLKGYKAALRDAVITFAEQQQQTKPDPISSAISRIRPLKSASDDFEDPRDKIIRTLSNGNLEDLAEDLELAALAKKALKSRSRSNSKKRVNIFEEDEDLNYEVVREPREDMINPRAGRPQSRNGSVRSRGNSMPRYQDDDDDRSVIINRRERPRGNRPQERSPSAESCDCSECDERLMMENTNGNRPQHHRSISPRSQSLRQRYIDSMASEGGSTSTRANVRARPPPNNIRYPEQGRQMNYDDVYYGDYRNSYPQKQNQRGVRFGY